MWNTDTYVGGGHHQNKVNCMPACQLATYISTTTSTTTTTATTTMVTTAAIVATRASQPQTSRHKTL